MRVISNDIDPDSVRRETRDGTEYLVAPVVLARAMELNGGYLPQKEIQRSAEAWNGVPVPIDHPTNDGEPISIDDDRADVPTVGFIDNAEAKRGGEFLTGEIWIDINAAQAAGSEGERVIARLQNGDALEVSTGYAPGRVVSGNFDGAHRERAVLDIMPDHLAVLPNDKGRCSVADHCGAGAPVAPVANRIMVANLADDGSAAAHPEDLADDHGMIQNVLDRARTPDFDGTETASWADVSKSLSSVTAALDIDAETVADLSDGQRETIASHTLLGDPDAETWRELFFFPVVNPSTGDLNRGALMAVRSGRGESADIPQDALESAQSVAGDLLEEEFDADVSENALRRAYNALKDVFGEPGDMTRGAESPAETTSQVSMGDKTQELVENHGFKADNLPDEDTECFASIYEQFTANDAGGTDEPDDSTESETNPQLDMDQLVDTLEERFVTADDLTDVVSDAIAANRDAERKHDLAEEIVANSDDYEDAEAVIEDYPTVAALETKRDDVTASRSANYGALRPASANGGASDDGEFPSPIANRRASQLEADD